MLNTFIRSFWDLRGLVYHGLALSYALLAYTLGILGLFNRDWSINLFATVLLGHGMTIAAYLIHECSHNTIFKTNEANARLGRFLNWITGSAYGIYEDIRFKHFRHHIDNDDIAWFDYEGLFHRHPLILKLTKLLEWCYIPAHDLIMHAIMVLTSFVIPQRRDQRVRNVTVIIVRGGIFCGVLIYFPKVAILYAVAYMLMMQILRFMDSLQHDYGPTLTLFSDEPATRRGDREWEQEHTFSNPLSLQHEWINWLTLNFGFHNAHHAKPITPWYRLPALHREMFRDDPQKVIPLRSQLKIFHKYRVARIMHAGGDLDGQPQRQQGRAYLHAAQHARVYGGNAASFLTAF